MSAPALYAPHEWARFVARRVDEAGGWICDGAPGRAFAEAVARLVLEDHDLAVRVGEAMRSPGQVYES